MSDEISTEDTADDTPEQAAARRSQRQNIVRCRRTARAVGLASRR